MQELLVKNIQTIPSYEVAKMMEIEHPKVLRMIEGDKTHIGIIPTLDKAQMGSISYFIKSSYRDSMNREKTCYECTKLGCDMLANKMTGEKGILFTARYVKKFEEMEEYIKQQIPQLTRKQELQLTILNGSELERVGALKEYEGLIQKPLIDEINERERIIDTAINDDGLFDLGVIGKLLKPYCEEMGAKKIFKFLKEKKILIDSPYSQKHNNPYDRYYNYFEMKVKTKRICGIEEPYIKTYFNGKGLKWFLKKLAREGYIKGSQIEDIGSRIKNMGEEVI